MCRIPQNARLGRLVRVREIAGEVQQEGAAAVADVGRAVLIELEDPLPVEILRQPLGAVRGPRPALAVPLVDIQLPPIDPGTCALAGDDRQLPVPVAVQVLKIQLRQVGLGCGHKLPLHLLDAVPIAQPALPGPGDVVGGNTVLRQLPHQPDILLLLRGPRGYDLAGQIRALRRGLCGLRFLRRLERRFRRLRGCGRVLRPGRAGEGAQDGDGAGGPHKAGHGRRGPGPLHQQGNPLLDGGAASGHGGGAPQQVRRPGPPGHQPHQGAPIGGPPVLSQQLYRPLVTGQLAVPAAEGCRQPRQGVVPVDDQTHPPPEGPGVVPLAEVGVLVGQHVLPRVPLQLRRKVDGGTKEAEEAGGGETLCRVHRTAPVGPGPLPPPPQAYIEPQVDGQQEDTPHPYARLPEGPQGVFQIHQPLQLPGVHRLLTPVPEGLGLLRAGYRRPAVGVVEGLQKDLAVHPVPTEDLLWTAHHGPYRAVVVELHLGGEGGGQLVAVRGFGGPEDAEAAVPQRYRQGQPQQHQPPQGVAQPGTDPPAHCPPQCQYQQNEGGGGDNPLNHGPAPPASAARHRAGRSPPGSAPPAPPGCSPAAPDCRRTPSSETPSSLVPPRPPGQ